MKKLLIIFTIITLTFIQANECIDAMNNFKKTTETKAINELVQNVIQRNALNKIIDKCSSMYDDKDLAPFKKALSVTKSNIIKLQSIMKSNYKKEQSNRKKVNSKGSKDEQCMDIIKKTATTIIKLDALMAEYKQTGTGKNEAYATTLQLGALAEAGKEACPSEYYNEFTKAFIIANRNFKKLQ